MNNLDLISHSPEETQKLGRRIGELALPGDVFLLVGDLGAGKTCPYTFFVVSSLSTFRLVPFNIADIIASLKVESSRGEVKSSTSSVVRLMSCLSR